MLHLLQTAGLSLTIAACCLGCSTTALETDSTVSSRGWLSKASTNVYSVYCRFTARWIQHYSAAVHFFSAVCYQHTKAAKVKSHASMIAVLSSTLKRLGTFGTQNPWLQSCIERYWALETKIGIWYHTNVPPTLIPKVFKHAQLPVSFCKLSLHAASVRWRDHYECHQGHLCHERTQAACRKFAQTPQLLWYIWRYLHCFLQCRGAAVSLYKQCDSFSALQGWTESAHHRIHWPSTWLRQ